jgi:hypothetical protein
VNYKPDDEEDVVSGRDARKIVSERAKEYSAQGFN